MISRLASQAANRSYNRKKREEEQLRYQQPSFKANAEKEKNRLALTGNASKTESLSSGFKYGVQVSQMNMKASKTLAEKRKQSRLQPDNKLWMDMMNQDLTEFDRQNYEGKLANLKKRDQVQKDLEKQITIRESVRVQERLCALSETKKAVEAREEYERAQHKKKVEEKAANLQLKEQMITSQQKLSQASYLKRVRAFERERREVNRAAEAAALEVLEFKKEKLSRKEENKKALAAYKEQKKAEYEVRVKSAKDDIRMDLEQRKMLENQEKNRIEGLNKLQAKQQRLQQIGLGAQESQNQKLHQENERIQKFQQQLELKEQEKVKAQNMQKLQAEVQLYRDLDLQVREREQKFKEEAKEREKQLMEAKKLFVEHSKLELAERAQMKMLKDSYKSDLRKQMNLDTIRRFQQNSAIAMNSAEMKFNQIKFFN